MSMLYFLILVSVAAAQQIQTDHGIVKGFTKHTRKGREIFAFEGIPYAKPPVGPLRFKEPQEADPWTEPLQATKPSEFCPQRNYETNKIIGREDCLYLNIYTPKLKGDSLLPVLVFIPGGGYVFDGADPANYGPEYLLDQDVILVVLNYRLGALGFFTTLDENAPGNFGLKDQSFALHWVYNNGRQFGGDPGSITIFGNGAGGISVYLQSISPLSNGLLSGIIVQSGSPFNAWGFLRNMSTALDNPRILAQKFKCPTNDNAKMIECLRGISAEEIIEADRLFQKWDQDPMIPFKPVIERNVTGAFLPEHPVEVVAKYDFVPIPWIMGYSTQDGCERPAAILSNKTLLKQFNKHFDALAPISLEYDQTSVGRVDEITARIKKFYFNDEPITQNKRENLIELYTDFWYAGPTDYAAILNLGSAATLYYYIFDYKGGDNFAKVWGKGNPSNPHEYGSCQKNELQFLFPMANYLDTDVRKHDPDDEKMIELLTTLWVNFATVKNPTPKFNHLIQSKWRPSVSKSTEYYSLNVKPKMEENPIPERRNFWLELANMVFEADLTIFGQLAEI